jgi:hypothetical protein
MRQLLTFITFVIMLLNATDGLADEPTHVDKVNLAAMCTANTEMVRQAMSENGGYVYEQFAKGVVAWRAELVRLTDEQFAEAFEKKTYENTYSEFKGREDQDTAYKEIVGVAVACLKALPESFQEG